MAKYYSYRVTPVCTTAAITAGKALVRTPTPIITGARPGQSVKLVSMTVLDMEDQAKNINVQFWQSKLGGAIAADGGSPNITDANVLLNVPLGAINFRHVGIGDMVGSEIDSTLNYDLVLTTSRDSLQGEIYFTALAAESSIDLAAADSYTFIFGFQVS